MRFLLLNRLEHEVCNENKSKFDIRENRLLNPSDTDGDKMLIVFRALMELL